MVKSYCDRCKKELPHYATFSVTDIGLHKIVPAYIIDSKEECVHRNELALTTHFYKNEYDFLLCKDCAKSFVDFISNKSH